jgi:hypothetical protein
MKTPRMQYASKAVCDVVTRQALLRGAGVEGQYASGSSRDTDMTRYRRDSVGQECIAGLRTALGPRCRTAQKYVRSSGIAAGRECP